MRLALLLLLVASPLWGQATPSIAQGSTETRGVVSLREYIDVRLNALEAKMDALNAARLVAIDKSETSINERLNGMNEFRNQLKDQAATFVTRDEMNIRARMIDDHLAALDNRFASLDGSIRAFGFLILVLQAGLAVMAFWMSRRRYEREERIYDRGPP